MNLESKTARAKLAIRKAAYFVRVGGAGVSLGYRRTQAPAGTWIARWSDGQEGHNQKAIGHADDIEPANGKSVLSFTQAADAVRRLVRTGSTEDNPEKISTVKEAIDHYAAGRSTGENVDRVRLHVPAVLAKRPVALVTSKELMDWRDYLAKRLAPASVNRVANVLRAILNRHADSDETIINRRAWEVGLASLPEAEEHNNVVIDDGAIRKLVIAAREQSAEFGLLTEALAVTGARVSQLARCKVRDLVGDNDAASLMVPSSAKGQKKRMTAAPVPIPAGLADRLRVAAAAREPKPADPLFVKPSGEPWAKSDHSRLFDRASIAAGINPKPAKLEKGQKPAPKGDDWVSIYTLRHSHIIGQILALVPLAVIAKTHDTSTPMIERHYAATIAKIADSAVRRAMTDFDQPTADVIPLRAGQPRD